MSRWATPFSCRLMMPLRSASITACTTWMRTEASFRNFAFGFTFFGVIRTSLTEPYISGR